MSLILVVEELCRRLREDLQGVLDGEVRHDALSVALYSTDGSLFQAAPLAVVYPRHEGDVQSVARYAAEHRIPMYPRGAGTGVAGQSLGSGLVIDFTRFMRRVLEIDGESARVQPGVVCDRLNALLAPRGLALAPDPAGSQATSVGSMLAVDAAGSHSLRYGSTRDHAVGARVVLADGSSFVAGREPSSSIRWLAEASQAATAEAPAWSPKQELLARLLALLKSRARLIELAQPRFPRDRAGYRLHGVLSNGQLDLARLLVGSEGTLAMFTEATLRVVPLPAERIVLLLMFASLGQAAEAVLELLPHDPDACDLLDRRLLGLARDADRRFERVIPPSAEAALLLEFAGRDRAPLQATADAALASLRRSHLPLASATASDRDEVEFFWTLPRRVLPLLYRVKGPARPVPFVEDVAVPPAQLPAFVARVHELLQRHEVTASLYAHAGACQVHWRPFLDPDDPGDLAKLRALAAELYGTADQLGGTLASEHGAGLARTPYLARRLGPLLQVFREVKAIFDPKWLLNPGKVVPEGAPPPEAVLAPRPLDADALAPALRWELPQLNEAVQRCNRCGACRTQEPGERMCPIFRMEPIEEASPRAKANLLRQVLTGNLDPDVLSSDDARRIADLCINCKQCRLECPAQVDVPKLVTELKAAHVAANGLAWPRWILSRAHLLGALGTLTYPFSNWALGNRTARWALEKLLGLARGRRMPAFAGRTFLRRAARRGWTKPPPRTVRRVAYFVDHYVNYHDPELGEALVAVLEHHGFSVYVPRRQRVSGMALITEGELDAAAELAQHNTRLLADLAREGYAIVANEPSAVVCLTQEYPALVDDPDAELLARSTREVCSFLLELQAGGELRRDFQPLALDIGYHTPCHLRALRVGTPGRDLLELIPKARVHTIERGCSAMAGTFGLDRRNFRTSIRAGWGLISVMRDGDFDCGATECSTCKIQMQQGTWRPTLHPLKLLALAYGLKPELRARLAPNPNPRVAR